VDRALAWARRQQESWRVDGTGRWLAYRRVGGELVGRGGPIWIEIAGHRVLDLGWAVRDAQTGRGYGTEIARASATYAFDVLLDEPALLTDIPLDRELAPFVQYRLDPDGFRVSRRSAGA
jgi:RimJ/RimL family protein N-acetyltransferase